MTDKPSIVFLFDVDNTLLDNDRIQAHLREHLAERYGTAARDRYWEILQQLIDELGYTDYLGALERYRDRGAAPPRNPADVELAGRLPVRRSIISAGV